MNRHLKTRVTRHIQQKKKQKFQCHNIIYILQFYCNMTESSMQLWNLDLELYHCRLKEQPGCCNKTVETTGTDSESPLFKKSAYYASIILDAQEHLLCSKLCQHNLSRCTQWHFIPSIHLQPCMQVRLLIYSQRNYFICTVRMYTGRDDAVHKYTHAAVKVVDQASIIILSQSLSFIKFSIICRNMHCYKSCHFQRDIVATYNM